MNNARLWSTLQASELLPLAQPVCDCKGRVAWVLSTIALEPGFYSGQRPLHTFPRFLSGPAERLTMERQGGCPSTNSPGRNLPGRGGVPAPAPHPPAAPPGSHLVPARSADQRGTRREVLLELRVRVLLAAVATAGRAAPGHFEGRCFSLAHRLARPIPSPLRGEPPTTASGACVRVSVSVRACAEASAARQPLGLKRRQPDSSSSVKEGGGGDVEGRGHNATARGMTSS